MLPARTMKSERHALSGRRGIPLPYQEQPLVASQFEHLWHAPERTMIEPHSWHVGASVSATQTCLSSDLAAGATLTEGRTGTFGRSSWLAAACSFGWRNFRLSQRKM